MKKILMVLMGLEIGGAETHVVELSLTLQKRGWEVLVASNGGVYEKTLEEHGIRHFSVPTHTRSPKMMRRAYVALEQIIRQEKPDIVHAHARIPAFLCGKLQKKLGFPFVTTAHGVFRINPMLRFLSNWGRQTLAVSEDIREYLIDQYDLPAGQIHVISNGIDTAAFSPEHSGKEARAEFQIPEDVPVVACVTRLQPDNSLAAELLLASAAALAEQNQGLRILLVGDGERLESFKHQAAAINQKLGYPCVVMTGGRTDVARLVAACDVFVGVSRAALEAMSAGKPTVLCGNAGYGGIAREEAAAANLASNYCCRGNRMGTAVELTADLQTLLTMPKEQRIAIGMEDRGIVERDFSLNAMVRNCETVYQLALQPKRRVVVSGYYGYENLGDETILGTICSRYREQYDLVVLSKQPHLTEKKFGVTAISRFHMRKVQRAIRGCDLLISGGGSLLQDRTSTRSLMYYLSVMYLAQRRKKPVVVYANGIGPVRGKRNRKLVVKVLQRASAITLRDEDSLRELRNMGLSRQDILVTADPVFSLEPVGTEVAKRLWAQAGIPTEAPVLGISLRAVSPNAAERLAELFDGICRDTGYIPVFLCMQPSSDFRGAKSVMELMNTKSYLLPDQLTAQEMMSALGNMKLVISMRLHTLIFAAAAGTPVMGFDYDPKVISMLRTLEMPSLGTVQDLNVAQGRQLVAEFVAREEDYRRSIKAAAQALRGKERENDRILQQVMSLRPEPSGVLFLIGGGDTGGAKTHVLTLLQGLMERGYRVKLVCFMEGPFAEDTRKAGIPIEVLPRTRVITCVKDLLQIIREMQPDLIHCHGAKANMFGRLLLPHISQPVLTTVHSDPQLDYLGRPAAKLIYGTINDWALRKIPYRECVSDTMRELLISRHFGADSLYVIYNGVAISSEQPPLNRDEFFEKIGLPVEPDSVVFGIAARLSPVKDIPTLLEAFSRVAAQEPSARLVIAGDGEDAENLHALAEKLCPRGTVCFAGWLQDTDSFYHAIDVNVLCSLSEGFPYALPEGGKMHCATIATAVGGIPYMVDDGKYGLLLQPKDVGRLAEHMLRMIREPEFRKQLAEAMYQRTCRDFSLEATVRTQQEIYRDILSREREKRK